MGHTHMSGISEMMYRDNLMYNGFIYDARPGAGKIHC